MNLIAYPILLILIPTVLLASDKSILVQSTTSTKNSGFYDFILPLFTADSGIKVNVVAVGTGAAIKNARNCDGDVLLVHSPEDEQKFIADGFSTKRHNIMHNDFVIVGPVADPAGIVGMQDVGLAFAQIATSGAKFASRSDGSGTHTKELSIWKKIGLDPVNESGKWYLETGSGMGKTLNITIGTNAYTLVDRASWYSFSNKYDHRVLLEGDSHLFNPYGVMLIDKHKCPTVKSAEGQSFINWLTSYKGQKTIGLFNIDGQKVFIPTSK